MDIFLSRVTRVPTYRDGANTPRRTARYSALDRLRQAEAYKGEELVAWLTCLSWKIIQEGLGMAQQVPVPGVFNNGSFRLCGLLWVSRWPNLQRYGAEEFAGFACSNNFLALSDLARNTNLIDDGELAVWALLPITSCSEFFLPFFNLDWSLPHLWLFPE